MARGEVENYLRARGIAFNQMDGIQGRDTFTDLLRIGQEEHPWYCSENYVYVAFEFTSSAKEAQLEKIDLYRQLGGCL